MNNCIICRKEITDFSDEHVIPDSLGGYYHIYSVCKKCNSNLGSNVDSDLVNHKFSDFQRYLLGIKGKSGEIPNPFSGTHSFRENPEKKVQVRLDDEMKIRPYIIPNVSQKRKGEIIESVNIIVDASDEDKIDEIIKKTAKRIGIPYDRISIGKKKIQSSPCQEIHIPLSIDLHDFKLGLLKIAYEFAADSIPEYYNDPLAVNISKVLYTASHALSTEFVKIGNGFQHEIMKPFEHLLDFESKKHYLILIQSTMGLICFIKLYQLFSIGVVLSEGSYLGDNLIVGINDIKNRSFRKVDGIQLINETHSKPEIRFQYWFENQEAADRFRLLENKPDFDIYKDGDEIPFFNKDGSYAGKTVHQRMSI